MKTIFLALALTTGFVSVSHAADKAPKAHKSNKKAPKGEKAPEVTYIDASSPDTDENAMPAITPKGKL